MGDYCPECEKLLNAGRHVQAHSSLRLFEQKRINSAMGSADEAYYECAKCNKKWLHETGSCGYGWIEQKN